MAKVKIKNIESLLDQEKVRNMKKRPGMYLGNMNHEAVHNLLSFIFKPILRNSKNNVEIELIILDDMNCSIHVEGGNLEIFKAYLEKFAKVEIPVMEDDYCYYVFYLLLPKLVISFGSGEYCLYIDKDKDTLNYDYSVKPWIKGCSIDITLDPQLFKSYAFLYESLAQYVKRYAYQYPNLKLTIRDDRQLLQLNTYYYPKGLQDQLDYYKKLKYGEICLWEVQYVCTIEGYKIEIYFNIADHIYLQSSRTIIYAEDDLILYQDTVIKEAVITAMLQSMEMVSEKEKLQLVFKEKQLAYLTDFVASIHGEGLKYAGSWKNGLDMPELKVKLTKHMKDYFDNLFSGDSRYIEIIEKIGFKKGNTLWLDACFLE